MLFEQPRNIPLNAQEETVEKRVENTLDTFEDTVDLMEEYCKKHPQLVPFKESIINEAMQILLENHVSEDEAIDDRMALDAGLQRFQDKLNAYMATQMETQQDQQASKNMHKMMLQLDKGASVPLTRKTHLKELLQKIGDNDTEFAALRKSYLESKGL
jgi:hypothetical protein